MGICFSATKVSGSNSNNATTTTTTAVAALTTSITTSVTSVHPKESTNTTQKDASSIHNKNNGNCNLQQKQVKVKDRRRYSGSIPCGKRTDFGYLKNFEKRYEIGKLLGHGQFGYTYVAIDKKTAERVAVKRIDKNKVCFL